MSKLLISIFVTILLVMSAGLSAAPKTSQHTLSPRPLNQFPLSEDDLLVVELSYDQLKLEEAFFIYQTPEHTFIPIQALVDILDFPMDIDLDTLSVDGWYISESKSFSLDIEKKSLFLEGIKQNWPGHFRYGLDGFDLYIDLRSIEKWFNFTLKLDVSQLKLRLASEEALPIIKQKLRSEKRAKLDSHSRIQTPTDYLPNHYDWLGTPAFDVELSYSADRFRSDTPLSSKMQISHFNSLSIQGAMDLFKHSMQTSYINQDGEQDLRITFSKAAEGPNRTLFLGVNEYQLGDITSHSDSLLFNPASGRGLHLQRGANSLLEQSNDLLIEGDAPPGWEVELYRNGALIDFSTPSSKGQYQFQNIATYLGENIFEVRIYGPQGQYRSEQTKISVGNQMLSKGTWDYKLYAMERNRRLVKTGQDLALDSSDFIAVETSLGLNEYLTLHGALSHFTPIDNNVAHDYLSIGFFASLAGGLSQFKLARDKEGGHALSASYKTRWLDSNYNIDLTKFNQLISDRNPTGDLDSDSKIRINGIWQDLLPHALSYDFELHHLGYQNSDQVWQVNKRLSTRIGQTQVANLLTYAHSSVENTEDSLRTTLSATRRWYQWRLKAEGNYRILPSDSFESANLSGSYQAGKRMTYQANLSLNRGEQETYSFDNSISWNIDYANISLSAGFDTQERQSLGLTLSSSLAYDKSADSLSLSRHSSASSARVIAQTYIDENNNERFDEGEAALENIRFKGKSVWRDRASNQSGLTTLSNIPNLSLQQISIDLRSIEDPFLKPKREHYQIFSHAGKSTELSIPLVPSLEIEGEIKLNINKQHSTLSNVPISLYTDEEQLILQTQSEYDGVFIFEGVLPGKYSLRVEQSYLERKKLSQTKALNINASSENGVIYLDSIILTPVQTTE